MDRFSDTTAVLATPSYDDVEARRAQQSRLLSIVAEREAEHGPVPEEQLAAIERRADGWPG